MKKDSIYARKRQEEFNKHLEDLKEMYRKENEKQGRAEASPKKIESEKGFRDIRKLRGNATLKVCNEAYERGFLDPVQIINAIAGEDYIRRENVAATLRYLKGRKLPKDKMGIVTYKPIQTIESRKAGEPFVFKGNLMVPEEIKKLRYDDVLETLEDLAAEAQSPDTPEERRIWLGTPEGPGYISNLEKALKKYSKKRSELEMFRYMLVLD